MVKLEKSLSAWGTPDFTTILKQEILQLDTALLPLQQGLSGSSSVSDAPITVFVPSVTEVENALRVRAGIFYQGIIGGCSCADDPTPDSDINEYCEVQLDIDRVSAISTITLLD